MALECGDVRIACTCTHEAERIDRKFTPDNISKVTVDLPKGNVLELESLIRNGDSVSMDDAIRNAVREYTRARAKVTDPFDSDN